ncbi:hypothetical protein LINGRAHAP2_LOCUS7921 [Linum grandiflorum]
MSKKSQRAFFDKRIFQEVNDDALGENLRDMYRRSWEDVTIRASP